MGHQVRRGDPGCDWQQGKQRKKGQASLAAVHDRRIASRSSTKEEDCYYVVQHVRMGGGITLGDIENGRAFGIKDPEGKGLANST